MKYIVIIFIILFFGCQKYSWTEHMEEGQILCSEFGGMKNMHYGDFHITFYVECNSGKIFSVESIESSLDKKK